MNMVTETKHLDYGDKLVDFYNSIDWGWLFDFVREKYGVGMVQHPEAKMNKNGRIEVSWPENLKDKCGLLQFVQGRVQAPVQEHRVVQHRVLLLQEVQAHPAVLAQRGLRLAEGQVRELVIPDLRVIQTAAHILPSFLRFGGGSWFSPSARFCVRPRG